MMCRYTSGILRYECMVGYVLLVFMYRVFAYVWCVGIHVVDIPVSCVCILVVCWYDGCVL